MSPLFVSNVMFSMRLSTGSRQCHYHPIDLPAPGDENGQIRMRHPRFALFIRTLVVAILIALAGCDAINQEQYRVAGVAAGSPQVMRLKMTLASVARQAGLEESHSASNVPKTIVVYIYKDSRTDFVTLLAARLYQGDALVDLLGSFGPTPDELTRTSRLLGPALKRAFGNKATLSSPPVPVNATP